MDAEQLTEALASLSEDQLRDVLDKSGKRRQSRKKECEALLAYLRKNPDHPYVW